MPHTTTLIGNGLSILVPEPLLAGGQLVNDNAKATVTAFSAVSTSLASKADTTHTHAIADTTGLQTALDAKASAASVTTLTTTVTANTASIASHVTNTSNPHSTTASQVGAYTSTQTDTLLAAKANTSHTHVIADVTSLSTTLTTITGMFSTLNGSNITTGTVAGARLAPATATSAGSMSSTHYSLVNGATSANTASAIVKRDTNGLAQVGPMTMATDGVSVSGYASIGGNVNVYYGTHGLRIDGTANFGAYINTYADGSAAFANANLTIDASGNLNAHQLSTVNGLYSDNFSISGYDGSANFGPLYFDGSGNITQCNSLANTDSQWDLGYYGLRIGDGGATNAFISSDGSASFSVSNNNNVLTLTNPDISQTGNILYASGTGSGEWTKIDQYGRLYATQVHGGYATFGSSEQIHLSADGTSTFGGRSTFAAGITSPGSGTGSEYFGNGATTGSATYSTAIGGTASIGNSSTNCTVIGYNAHVSSSTNNAVAIGTNATTSGNSSVAIGTNSSAYVASTAIGNNASTTNQDGVAIGNGVSAGSGICMGSGNDSATYGGCVQLGAQLTTGGYVSSIIGRGITTTGHGDFFMGMSNFYPNIPFHWRTFGSTSTQSVKSLGGINFDFVTSTTSVYTTRATMFATDYAGDREGVRVESNGSAPLIGFLGASAVARQTVSAAATDAATTQSLVNSLRTALINLGLTV